MPEVKRTEIADIGEFALIERLSQKVQINNTDTVRGIGDDAAVLKSEAGQLVLISSDMLLEGIHFDLTYMPLKHLG